MAHRAAFRKELSKPGLLRLVRVCFEEIADEIRGRRFRLSDYLMSGLAVFVLKYPSLLQFDEAARDDEVVRGNLLRLFGIRNAPSDSGVRKRLDLLDPALLRPAFKRAFAALQRGEGLEGFTFFGGRYLLSVDGTGYFSSSKVHCEHCCEKKHRDGSVTYYHQMLGAVLVHPEHREVFPFPPEAIQKSDGATKNDCEIVAAKRLLASVRREHPHLKLIVLQDGLASKGPHIRLLQELDMRFLLTAKRGDHEALFEALDGDPGTGNATFEDERGFRHEFRFLEGVGLNRSHPDLKVNAVEYWEIRPNGKRTCFSWVTDLPVHPDALMALMRAGRARWRIENETFNTLKNHGCNFEHNFGHGEKHLSTVFAQLMMLAFLIDQIELRCCELFKAALRKARRPLRLRAKIRFMFDEYMLSDWEHFYGLIAYGRRPVRPEILDTS